MESAGTFLAPAAHKRDVLGRLQQIRHARVCLVYAEERLAQTIAAVEQARSEAFRVGHFDVARCARLATDYLAAKRQRDVLLLLARGPRLAPPPVADATPASPRTRIGGVA